MEMLFKYLVYFIAGWQLGNWIGCIIIRICGGKS